MTQSCKNAIQLYAQFELESWTLRTVYISAELQSSRKTEKYIINK